MLGGTIATAILVTFGLVLIIMQPLVIMPVSVDWIDRAKKNRFRATVTVI